MPVAIAHDAERGREQRRAVGIFGNTLHRGIIAAGLQQGELSIGIMQRAMRRAEPGIAQAIRVGDRGHRRVDAAVAAIEDDEARTVETGDGVLGADPQVTGAVLGDAEHRNLRQTAFDVPVIADVIVETRVWIQRVRVRAGRCGDGKQPARHGARAFSA